MKSHSRAIDVLKKANGKKDYKKIAEEIGLNEKTVSPLLKKAERLGLVKCIKRGIYKMKPGISGFKPPATYRKQEIHLPKRSFKSKINRSKNSLEKEGWKNAEVYPLIFVLENTLRKLILQQLGNGIVWWKKPFVIPRIIEYAKRISDEEKEVPWIQRKGNHPIYYITLKQLSKIIGLNWKKFNKLSERDSFFARLKDMFPIRNSLAHNVPLTARDKKEAEISVDKICKIIRAKYNI